MFVERIQAILNYWFGDLSGPDVYPESKAKLWFNGGSAVHREIQKMFTEDFERAKTGILGYWESMPQGCLALILLYDQFSRHFFQDSRMFQYDAQALDLAMRGVQDQFDAKLKPMEKWFFYKPFTRSEDLDMQKKSMDLYTKLHKESPPAIQTQIKRAYDDALRQYQIIEKYGRFPQRNALLGRESTSEEIEFLKEAKLPL